jgi:poly [ADP-ribose] polymerase
VTPDERKMKMEKRGVVKMVMVEATNISTGANNNKTYQMSDNGDGSWTAEWGRVGQHMSTKVYSMHEWDKKYREKTKKGYKDITHLCAVQTASVGFADISDSAIAKIVADLQAFANKSVSTNYIVTADSVTQAQVSEAQRLLDDLIPIAVKGKKTGPLNNILLEIFRTIPRKMDNVRNYQFQFSSIKTDEELSSVGQMIQREQDMLDAMRGQVGVATAQKQQTTGDQQTLLQAMGIEMFMPSAADVNVIKGLLGSCKDRYHSAYGVKNIKTEKRFNDWLMTVNDKTRRLYWHGSRNENWWSILDSGLLIRPSNAIYTGSMHGDGIYGSDQSQKSLGYSSLSGSYWTRGSSNRGFLSLYDFHVGRPLIISEHESWCYNLSWDNLRRRGDYHSLAALAGKSLRNNEYVFYQPCQMTVRFLVELR